MSSTAIRKNKAEGAAQPEPETSRPRPERRCSVRKTVEIVLDSWTFLVVREAFFGVRRFDKFQSRLGVPRQTLSSRLAMLGPVAGISSTLAVLFAAFAFN